MKVKVKVLADGRTIETLKIKKGIKAQWICESLLDWAETNEYVKSDG